MERVSSSTDLASSDGETYALSKRIPCFAILFTPGEDASTVLDISDADAILGSNVNCEPVGSNFCCLYIYNVRSLELVRRKIPDSTTCYVLKLAAGHEAK